MRLLLLLFATIVLAGCTSRLAPPPAPTLTPLENQGRMVFSSACASCHSASGDIVIVGPSLAGIAARAGERMQGLDAETYIKLSILDPDAFTVPSFERGTMPVDIASELSDRQLEALVAYLLTLH